MSDDNWHAEAEEALRDLMRRREARHRERLAHYETFIISVVGLFGDDRPPPKKIDVLNLISAFRELEERMVEKHGTG